MATNNRRPGPGRSYGTAGKSLGSSGAQSRFGDRAAVGAQGERAFLAALQADRKISNDYNIYSSLEIPTPPRGKKVHSDVDVALANGRKLILVDVKMWKSGVHWWTFGGKAMANLSPQHDKQLSKNMEMALERYRKALPGIEVEAIVAFVGAGKNGNALPASVYFLRWPGGIRSYLPGSAIKRLKTFLGSQEDIDPRIHALMGQMVRR